MLNFIYVHTGGHGHYPPGTGKVIIGIWILLNLLWLFSWLLTLMRYVLLKKKLKEQSNNKHYSPVIYLEQVRSDFTIEIFDLLMYLCWVVILFILGGWGISKLF